MQSQFIVTLIFSLVMFNTAQAIEIKKIAGHDVAISEASFDKELKVDGRSLHKNAIISFDELVVIEGTLALIGSSSPGGNSCNGSPFVLSFPSSGQPKMDGPLDTCAWFEQIVEAGAVIFSTHEVPGQNTERWKWTPAGGFMQMQSVMFQPDQTLGWDNLRERSLGHPSSAFANAGLAASIKVLLGPDFNWYQELMAGVGSGEFRGDDYVGTSCRPHNCMDEAGILFLSAREKRVYAAWKPEGRKIVVVPLVKEWPEKAKAELRQWAARWK